MSVVVLGSTGSIGCAALEVIRRLGSPYRLHGVSAHRNVELLREQIANFRPKEAILTDEPSIRLSKWGGIQGGTQCRSHSEALTELVQSPEVDIVVAAIVGIAGLPSCLAAAETGKRLALANKEAMVVAGPLLKRIAEKTNCEILPVDSEHSAIFQALQSGRGTHQVRRLILTASGGSLREWPMDRLDLATPADALKHPTWNMGKKITIDSATMMNKALEIVEARWLFDIPAEKIQVVIHPQSVIHSMVEFVDGSIMAQLSPPDMRLPIQYALTFPDRMPGISTPMDWSQGVSLEWTPADIERFPALALGFEVAQQGGTCGAVLNGANEEAVALFLDGTLRFTDISAVCRDVLRHHTFDPNPNLECLNQMDSWARSQVKKWAKVSL